MLTIERLKELLSYDPETGQFVWIRSDLNLCGKVAGCLTPMGGLIRDRFYYKIGVDNERYYSHVLAFLYMTGKMPSGEIDHINCDGTDNRWRNLRLADKSKNGLNRLGPNKNNSSGYVGVSFHSGAGRWRARYMLDGKEVHIGFFDNPKAAHIARTEALQSRLLECQK